MIKLPCALLIVPIQNAARFESVIEYHIPAIPRCVGEPEKKIPVVFIVVDSQNFERQGIDFFQILESFYVCQSDRNILRST